jgi:hypothetical protein
MPPRSDNNSDLDDELTPLSSVTVEPIINDLAELVGHHQLLLFWIKPIVLQPKGLFLPNL